MIPGPTPTGVAPAPLPMMVHVGQADNPAGGKMVALQVQSPQGVTFIFLDLKAAESVAKQMLKVAQAGHLTLAVTPPR